MPKFRVILRGGAQVTAKNKDEASRALIVFLQELKDAYMKWDYDPVQNFEVEIYDMEETE